LRIYGLCPSGVISKIIVLSSAGIILDTAHKSGSIIRDTSCTLSRLILILFLASQVSVMEIPVIFPFLFSFSYRFFFILSTIFIITQEGVEFNTIKARLTSSQLIRLEIDTLHQVNYANSILTCRNSYLNIGKIVELTNVLIEKPCWMHL
jgi:hypothetical protein